MYGSYRCLPYRASFLILSAPFGTSIVEYQKPCRFEKFVSLNLKAVNQHPDNSQPINV